MFFLDIARVYGSCSAFLLSSMAPRLGAISQLCGAQMMIGSSRIRSMWPAQSTERRTGRDGDEMVDPHLKMIRAVTPSAEGCEDCLRIGPRWVHLRLCLTCGPEFEYPPSDCLVANNKAALCQEILNIAVTQR